MKVWAHAMILAGVLSVGLTLNPDIMRILFSRGMDNSDRLLIFLLGIVLLLVGVGLRYFAGRAVPK
jgi:hypothetical protein